MFRDIMQSFPCLIPTRQSTQAAVMQMSQEFQCSIYFCLTKKEMKEVIKGQIMEELYSVLKCVWLVMLTRSQDSSTDGTCGGSNIQ